MLHRFEHCNPVTSHFLCFESTAHALVCDCFLPFSSLPPPSPAAACASPAIASAAVFPVPAPIFPASSDPPCDVRFPPLSAVAATIDSFTPSGMADTAPRPPLAVRVVLCAVPPSVPGGVAPGIERRCGGTAVVAAAAVPVAPARAAGAGTVSEMDRKTGVSSYLLRGQQQGKGCGWMEKI